MESLILRRISTNFAHIFRATHKQCKQISIQRLPLSDRQQCSLGAVQYRCYSVVRPPNPGGKAGEGEAFIFRGGKSKENQDIHKAFGDIKKGLDKRKSESQMKGLKIGILILTAMGFAFAYVYASRLLRGKELELVNASQKTADPIYIGGQWELTDHFGNAVTSEDFHGDWCIVYFGFTHCPDICPDEIEKIIEVTEILERKKDMPRMIPLFVTVDPERDSPEIMKEYLEEFSPKLIGLTGSWDQLNVILKEFKVYHSRGPKDEDGDYIVDHSIITFLMNPDGKYTAHFARSKTNLDIAAAIESHVKLYKKNQ